MKKTHKDYYALRKADVREEAIQWQAEVGSHNYSYGEFAWWSDHFERLGRRYGLLREFRENAIC